MQKIESTARILSDNIRRHIVQMCHNGQSSHIGSGLSVADVIASIYSIMNIRSEQPTWVGRDYFILSKGHAGAVVYAVLAELNFFPEEKLKDHYSNGSTMSGHVSHFSNPGVEFSTGSLGHGLSVSCGIAKALKVDGLKNRVFCVLSDGEMGEGSNWEAMLFAAHHKLDNLVALIDRNHLQSIGDTEKTLALEPLEIKCKSFGWDTVSVDGHNHEQILDALNDLSSKPKMIICETIKGKGVSFMENSVEWHYKPPNEKELNEALQELGKKLPNLEKN